MELPVLLALSQEKDDLLSHEGLSLETCFSAVKVVDHITFFELPFEWLDHYRTDAPVLITTNTSGDFSLLNANVSDDLDRFVIAS
jgi:hypothetical protein